PALLLEIQTARPSVAAPSGPEKPGSRIRAVTRFVRALMRISFPVALVTTQTVEPRTATPCGPDRNPSLIVLTTRFVAESMRWTVPRSKLVTQTAPAPTARYRALPVDRDPPHDRIRGRIDASDCALLVRDPDGACSKGRALGPFRGPHGDRCDRAIRVGSDSRDGSPTPNRQPDRPSPGDDADRALPHLHDRGDLVRRPVDGEHGVSVEARHPGRAVCIRDADRVAR